jgi:hypothetical protein
MVTFMSTKLGHPAKEQKIIATAQGRYLQSYQSVVAFIPKDKKQRVRLGRQYDYSQTTIYYLGKFLGMSLPAIREGIASGAMEVDDRLAVV